MITLVAQFTMKAGAVSRASKLVDAVRRQANEEQPGTLLYLVHRVLDAKGRETRTFLFYECYRDDAALTAHLREQFMEGTGQGVAKVLRGERDRDRRHEGAPTRRLRARGPVECLMKSARASLLALVVIAACLLTLYSRRALLATGSPLLALQLLAIVLMIWARITFGMRSFHAAANPTEGGLVTTGPYALVRHPIYAAILLFLWPGDHRAPLTGERGAGGAGYRRDRRADRRRRSARRGTLPRVCGVCGRTKRLIPGLY